MHPKPTDLTRVYHLRENRSVGIFDQQKELHNAADIPMEKRLYLLDDVDKFQTALKGQFRLFVFERSDKLRCIYSGTPGASAKNIFLFVKNNHYHLITDIQRFLPPKTHFCIPCSEAYTVASSYKHLSCKHLCQSCEMADCSGMESHCPEISWIKCDACNRHWSTVECFENHKKCPDHRNKSICASLVRCEHCQKTIPKSQKENNKHKCFELYCIHCKQKYIQTDDAHVCCIPRDFVIIS